MADWLSAEQRSRNMAAIRSAGTGPERRLGLELRKRFPRRHIVERPRNLPGRPDFYMPGFKLALFADGCFWHCCPVHGRVPDDNPDYWIPKLERNVERDLAAAAALQLKGIRALRFWEHELRLKTIDDAMARVEEAASDGGSRKRRGSPRQDGPRTRAAAARHAARQCGRVRRAV